MADSPVKALDAVLTWHPWLLTFHSVVSHHWESCVLCDSTGRDHLDLGVRFAVSLAPSTVSWVDWFCDLCCETHHLRHRKPSSKSGCARVLWGGPSTVINSFYPVVQQAMNVIEYHFQKSEPLLHSLSLSQPAVERAVYDLIMILSTQLFSLEMVWNLSIFDFLAPFIRFLFGKGRHKVMTCPCSCATRCPPGGHLDT